MMSRHFSKSEHSLLNSCLTVKRKFVTKDANEVIHKLGQFMINIFIDIMNIYFDYCGLG